MITREDVNVLHSFTQALRGFVFGIILAYFALINLDFGRLHISFMFLPVMIIFLWPPKASETWSLIFVFLLGVFVDVLTSGPIGVWALSYLLLFILMGGGIGQKLSGFLAFASFALALTFVYVMALVFGRFVLGDWPDAGSLAINALASFFVFSIIYGLVLIFTDTQNLPAQSKARL